jgi:23S rRNA (cytidine1920-2'-O)/16S rRNA (cytidine1409-2'-O)-methyltransferase
VRGWFRIPVQEKTGEVVSLIKPQFEAGRREVSRGKGVIRDPKIHQKVLVEVLSHAASAGYAIKGLERSPILGPKGNTEFLMWLGVRGKQENRESLINKLISDVLETDY